jgi:multidrug transporter EmrE-like cation transporter
MKILIKHILSNPHFGYYPSTKLPGGPIMMIFALILLGVLLNAAAQILLKAGMTQIGHFEFSMANAIPVGLQVIGNVPIIIGLSFYVISVGVWLLVLSRVPVSFAYPMLSIGYIVNALAAFYLFGEPLTSIRMLGIFIIIAGVYLVAQGN